MKQRKTYDIILKHAEELFAEKGFVETTVQQTAKKAGFAKGTVFLHFKSKNNLIHRVVEKIFSDFQSNLTEQMKSEMEIGDIFVTIIKKQISILKMIYSDFKFLPLKTQEFIIFKEYSVRRDLNEYSKGGYSNQIRMFFLIVHSLLAREKLFDNDKLILKEIQKNIANVLPGRKNENM